MKPEPSSFCNAINRQLDAQEKTERSTDMRFLLVLAAMLIASFAFTLLVLFP